MSWVSDLVWLDEHPYDPATGIGSVGVEFAGSAVSSPCPYGQNISMANANKASAWLVENNRELQWQDVCKLRLSITPDMTSNVSLRKITAAITSLRSATPPSKHGTLASLP